MRLCSSFWPLSVDAGFPIESSTEAPCGGWGEGLKLDEGSHFGYILFYPPPQDKNFIKTQI